MVRPARVFSALSPPPIRRASPPASSTPTVGGRSIVIAAALALGADRLVLDVVEVLVEHDPLLPRQRDEAFSARAANQRQPDLPRQLHAPGGEAGARHEDRNSHPHG